MFRRSCSSEAETSAFISAMTPRIASLIGAFSSCVLDGLEVRAAFLLSREAIIAFACSVISSEAERAITALRNSLLVIINSFHFSGKSQPYFSLPLLGTYSLYHTFGSLSSTFFIFFFARSALCFLFSSFPLWNTYIITYFRDFVNSFLEKNFCKFFNGSCICFNALTLYHAKAAPGQLGMTNQLYKKTDCCTPVR